MAVCPLPSPSNRRTDPVPQAIRAQIAARMAALGKPSPASASPSPAPSPPIAPPAAGSNLTPDVTSRLAALKERIAAQQAKIGNLPSSSSVPTIPTQQPPANPYLVAARPSPTPVDAPPLKPGLGSVAPHPLLADLTSGTSRAGTPSTSSGKNRYAPMVPKFTSVKANARFAGAASAGTKSVSDPKAGVGLPRVAPALNPYTSAGSAATPTPLGTASPTAAGSQPAIPDLPSSLFARRAKPTLKFNQKGKYIQRAEEMRHEAKMEALRQRIAENARKAGLDSEFEVLERSVKRQPPPEVEWWDAPLLRDSKYEDLDRGMKEGTIVYDEGNQHVTLFVQHPIPIPAPWEGKMPELRGLMLTKKVSLSCIVNGAGLMRRGRNNGRCGGSDVRPNCRINEIDRRWACSRPTRQRVRLPSSPFVTPADTLQSVCKT